MRLWRYATVNNPYFGKGSYWTPSRVFVDEFASWNDRPEIQERTAGTLGHGPRRLYVAEVSDEEVWDL